MQKERYEKVEMELVEFKTADVILRSDELPFVPAGIDDGDED